MIPNPIAIASANEAKKNLISGAPLRDLSITGLLIIEPDEPWEKVVIIENCIIENFNCIMVVFKKQVTIRNSHVKAASFHFCYFTGGLIIENCVFDEYLDFNAGGHNLKGNLVTFNNNHFFGFVNFFDCWYNGEIVVKNNVFEKGTNILSKNLCVSFDIPIIIHDNLGELDIESECSIE